MSTLLSSFLAMRRCLLFLFIATAVSVAQAPSSDTNFALYQQLHDATLVKSFALKGAVLQRDRARITFTDGTLYLSPAISGKVRSAVFIGSGDFQAPPPPVSFEQENVRRMLKADDVSSDFKTVVLHFTDDTADELLKSATPVNTPISQSASELARESADRLLKDSGINFAARQLGSILNSESPGVFLARFAGGKRGHFSYILDYQTRVPAADFGINAGEKGIVFAHNGAFSDDVWMAFYSQDDYAKRTVSYSDTFDLVDTEKYTLKLDVTEPNKVLGLGATMDLISRSDNVQLIPFKLGEGLRDDERLKKQLHVNQASLSDGTALTVLQEPWEGGFSIVLPKPVQAGRHFTVILQVKGDFMEESEKSPSWGKSMRVTGLYFPRSSETWYPRHGYLNRSAFDITILHRKRDNVVSIGQRIKDEPAPDSKDTVLTQFRMEQPVALATFAVADYEIHRDKAKQENGKELPIEFYSMPGSELAIKEDFILAELSNSVRYFSKLYGDYPYPVFRAAFHPFGYGQGFATTIMMPDADSSGKKTFSFISHETSHQWWGDQVLWRSYQDQWLSEGFAEYSGMMYVNLRDQKSSEKDLVRSSRETLKLPPVTLQGINKGRLADVGPLIMGHRVETRETRGAYQALAYDKGALVLRMLHFLFTDPESGNGQAFQDLMADFVRRYSGQTVTSRDFLNVVNERVKNTPLARKYGYGDVNWFYRQWVLETALPSYELTYQIEDNPSGGVILKGELVQRGTPENEKWFMPLPLIIRLPGGKMARGTVAAYGSTNQVNIKLPQRPEKIELDPDMWILSEKTSASKK